MPYDPLMRWENEGGAVVAANEGNDHRDRSQSTRSSRRCHDRRDRRVVQTGTTRTWNEVGPGEQWATRPMSERPYEWDAGQDQRKERPVSIGAATAAPVVAEEEWRAKRRLDAPVRVAGRPYRSPR